MSPQAVNILWGTYACSMVAALALLLRIHARVRQVTRPWKRRHTPTSRYYHERRFCQRHQRSLTNGG